MLRTWWIFTFGFGQEHGGKYVRIWGTYSEARAKMFKKYGDKWAFQYEEKEYLNYFKTHRNSETKGCERSPSVEAWYETDFCNYGERRESGANMRIKGGDTK